MQKKKKKLTSPFDFLQDKKQSELNLTNDLIITWPLFNFGLVLFII